MNPDEANDLLKARHVMKWDVKKKKHVVTKIDSAGHRIKEKRNEAGVKITGKDRPHSENSYQKFMKRTHMKIQNIGEMENERVVN